MREFVFSYSRSTFFIFEYKRNEQDAVFVNVEIFAYTFYENF